MKIRKIMSKPAQTCRLDDTLNIAAKQMWEHDCGVVPVVNEHGSIVGMLTDRDICMSAYTQGRVLSAIPVSEAMATKIFSVHANDTVEAAEKVMREQQIHRVPVIDGDNRPVGVLSLNDIARFASSSSGNGIDRDVVQTLAAISQPRPAGSQKQEALEQATMS